MAWQALIARDVELLLLHHERKAEQGGKRHHTLDDVYGSTWLTSGLGSVIALDGEPGDPTIVLKHLKQPAEPVSELTIRFDHSRGAVSVFGGSVDLLAWLVANPAGLTARQLAQAVIGRAAEADLQKVHRQLRKLQGQDPPLVSKQVGKRTASGAEPDRWFATAEARFALTVSAE
jgi:hypothetical protein